MLLEEHYQNAYVTRNLDKALALFRSRYGVDKVLQFQPQVEVKTPAGSGPAVFKTAFAWVGTAAVRIHRAGVGHGAGVPGGPAPGRWFCLSPCLHARARLGPHAGRDRARSAPVVVEGATACVRSVYVDARATLGHYLEYAWMKPETWAAMGGS